MKCLLCAGLCAHPDQVNHMSSLLTDCQGPDRHRRDKPAWGSEWDDGEVYEVPPNHSDWASGCHWREPETWSRDESEGWKSSSPRGTGGQTPFSHLLWLKITPLLYSLVCPVLTGKSKRRLPYARAQLGRVGGPRAGTLVGRLPLRLPCVRRGEALILPACPLPAPGTDSLRAGVFLTLKTHSLI